MEHLSESDLIKHAAGEIAGGRCREVETHLADCQACRALQADFSALRGLLGEWEVEAATADNWSAIERRLDQPRSAGVPRVWRVLARGSRVAAAVLLGIGLGRFAGRSDSAMPTTSAPAVVAGASEQEAVQELGIYALEAPSSAGLFTTVLELTDASGDEGGRP